MMDGHMKIAQARQWLAEADGLLITAGAGMGVDSGLPDFRGENGFWRAYPALREARIDFQSMASEASFRRNPARAWGFYGHRLQLYRYTVPHHGFHILQQLASRLEHGCFVFTSNVDGQFQKAGFDPQRIVECHGSIHHLQCLNACTPEIWPADTFVPVVDEALCLLSGTAPACPHCQGLARPNIYLFDDWEWLDSRSKFQNLRLNAWLAKVSRLVIIEIGAGTAIPTVRRFGERLGQRLIRINPRDAGAANPQTQCIPLGALAALEKIGGDMAGWAE